MLKCNISSVYYNKTKVKIDSDDNLSFEKQ